MPISAPYQCEARRRAGERHLRVAVIGLGVGEAHAVAYRNHPDCEVAALCDFSEKRLHQVGAGVGNVALHTCAAEILDDPDIDIVSIASYDNWHYDNVVRAINGNKHVFVEKPLCLRAEEALHIRDLLRAKPHLKLSSNLILRMCPRFAEVKKRIETGSFGELFLIEGDYHYGRLHKITEGWRGLIDFYSVVCGGAVHMVDLLLWLSGERITEVAAFGNRIASRGSRFRYDDTVVSTLKFEGGLVGKVGVSFGCVRPHFHGLSVYGTEATFINDEPDGLLYESRDPQVEPRRIRAAYPGVHKGDLIASFVDSIVHDREPVVSTEDVFRTMSVCLAIDRAVATGETCRVEYL